MSETGQALFLSVFAGLRYSRIWDNFRRRLTKINMENYLQQRQQQTLTTSSEICVE